MNLDIFKTPCNLPFLYYSTEMVDFNDSDGLHPRMTLECHEKPIIEQPSLDDLWTLVDIKYDIKHKDAPMLAANKLCNTIARNARRGFGNIVFVPTEALKLRFDEHYTKYKLETSVIVDTALEPNELRATYWKIMYKKERVGLDIITTDIPQCVDGGLQLSPEGFSCIRIEGNCHYDYRSYFARGFM